ncbi:MAG: ATPase domain-containing protein [Candidatus Nanohaloarchaea archaeon]|nr:ATPase domain-containing protein [Candidatus Nanohaloarchaea archaeon]
MPEVKKLRTGIQGLDELLNGGIPENHSVFLAGPAGSGKTTFGLEFLYKGAKEYGQNGLYISFEETKEQIIGDLPFNWDIKELMKSGDLNVVKYDPYQYEDVIDLIRSSVKDNQAERVVVDSLTALSLYVDNTKDVRKLILDMNEQLRDLGVTTIYTGEIKSGHPEEISRYGVEEFIADGVITLLLSQDGAELTNRVLVRKMRGTDHDKKIHPFKFNTDGLKVYAKEEAFESSSDSSSRTDEPF